ncbi:hypothetical protein HYH03_012220 [Edaphochlamys debaryana]|uniref:Uncharacterized protein n=1 Tax=Edaphochlamys debaryana TaxID=47281 RepID=A0A835XT42_9CHLO|nr:hypothetical protein HYH03_012220 [Edaphochlamys debaryana]|eukprot:KAG2489195.1 hypothetical protein HYH03_012220 [Edaphochlamys debaryana]
MASQLSKTAVIHSQLKRRAGRVGLVPLQEVVWDKSGYKATAQNLAAVAKLCSSGRARLAMRRPRSGGPSSVVDFAVAPSQLKRLPRRWQWCENTVVVLSVGAAAWESLNPYIGSSEPIMRSQAV